MKKKFLVLILALSLAIVPLFFVSINTYAYTTNGNTGDSYSYNYVEVCIYDSDVDDDLGGYIDSHGDEGLVGYDFYLNVAVIYYGADSLGTEKYITLAYDYVEGVDTYYYVLVVNSTDSSVLYRFDLDYIEDDNPHWVSNFYLDGFHLDTLYTSYFGGSSADSYINVYNRGMGEQIADAMTGTFTLGTSILSALTSFFDVFVLTDGSLSWITIFLFAMLGISLVVGMTRWITSLIRRKI